MREGAADLLRVLRLCSVFEPPADLARAARFDPVGGMQNHTTALTRALDALGVRQQVVTTRPPGTARRERLGRHTHVHRVGFPVPVLRQLYAMPAAALLPRLARGASLIHAHLGEDLAVLPLAFAAARPRRLPVVITVHASPAHTVRGDGARDIVLRRAGGRLERLGEHRAAALIVLTPRLAKLLEQDGIARERIHVIPSGVVAGASHVPQARSRPPQDGARILFVGRLAAQKGVRHLVEATARLEDSQARVLLVGDGPQRPALERLARRLGVEDRVSFLGFRPHDEVPALLAAADLLVLPSIYEELGSVLLEGMQAGVPIVASDTGGIPFALGDAGVLVPPGDAAALARAIDALLSDPGRRRRLAGLASDRAQRFHWKRLAPQVLDVYRDVLDARPRGRRDGGENS